MKKAVLLATSLLFAAGAFAAETKDQLVERYFAVTDVAANYRKNLDDSYLNAVNSMAKNLTPAQVVKLDKANKRVLDLMHTEMGWEKMKPRMVAAASATFTEDELKAAIAFYETPAGKSFSAKAGVFAQSSMKTGMELGASLQPKIRQIMTEEMSAPDAPAK